MIVEVAMKTAERSDGGTLDYRPKPQRGRPARLSRPAILDAGLALIKVTGIENLTMRSLAQALNVAPMSGIQDRDTTVGRESITGIYY